MLAIIGGVVLVSPILGIQAARGVISNFKDPEDQRFSAGGDPEWSVTPSAKRKKKQAELQAQLDAEKKRGGSWFGR